MELKLELNFNVKDNSEEKKERVAAAKAKKKAAEETIEEAFERVGNMALSDKEYEIYRIAKEAFFTGKIGRLAEGKLNKGEVLSMGAKILRDQEAELRTQRIVELLAKKPANFHVLTSDDQLEPFVNRVREEVLLQRAQWKDRFKALGVESMTAGDYEGTGVDTYLDLSIGFSIWLPILNEGYYLAYGHVHVEGLDSDYGFMPDDPQLTRSKAIEALAPYLGAQGHGKTFHMGSARYDLHIAINDGYNIRSCVWDTLDAMNLMNEHLDRYGLKPLIQRYGERFLGIEGTIFTFEDLFGKRSPAPFNTEIVGIYAIYDVYYGWKLFEWQFETMKKTDRLLECYAQIDSKLPETDVFMTRCGFEVDLDEFRQLEEEFTQKIVQAKEDVFAAYEIDEQFLYNMSMTINGAKIQEWKEKQRNKIAKLQERIAKQEEVVKKCEEDGKTLLKKYSNALEAIEKAEAEINDIKLALQNEETDLYIKAFEFTNNNHIGYLIYDHLAITDKTGKVKRGKKRSTANDVMEMYYEQEEALKPLAVVAEYEKLLNTYVRKILGTEETPTALDVDGRFHSEFKSGGTATGRYSSAAYNGRPNDILDEFKQGA